MNNYRYILEKYTGKNSRFDCPECGEANQFSKYIDIETGEALGNEMGRCNRVDKCGFHKLPPLETKCYFVPTEQIIDYSGKAYKVKADNKGYFLPKSQVLEISEKGCYVSEYILNDLEAPQYIVSDYKYFDSIGTITGKVEVHAPKSQPPPRPISFIEPDIFNNSLKGYENNKFVDYLYTLFDPDVVTHLINIYKIGTSTRYNGGTTVFWQIDILGNVRTGKLIKYDNTGHRVKGCNNWVHTVMKLENFNLKQCFFGEHILKHAPGYKVGIVESEKTAMILQAQIPSLVWLASGGAEGINKEKVKALRGRDVILFPDASKDGRIFKKWKEKAEQFGFHISDYLEQFATNGQKAKGVDIADLVI